MTLEEGVPIWQLHAYAAAGALLLWGKLGKYGREVYGLSDILRRFGFSDRARLVLEPILFVAIGAFLAVVFVQPTTVAQAVAAGLGWTSIASRSTRST
jgi:hypothetical protein